MPTSAEIVPFHTTHMSEASYDAERARLRELMVKKRGSQVYYDSPGDLAWEMLTAYMQRGSTLEQAYINALSDLRLSFELSTKTGTGHV